MTDLEWFRSPSPTHSGTANLCYNALDRHVIAGRAGVEALRGADRTLTFAQALEEVATVAGLFEALGVTAGAPVCDRFDEPLDRALVALAVARVGGVLTDRADQAFLVTADLTTPNPHTGGTVRVLRDLTPADEQEVTWALGLRAGREQPAGCAEVPGDAVAWSQAGRTTTLAEALASTHPAGRLAAALAAGHCVDLAAWAQG